MSVVGEGGLCGRQHREWLYALVRLYTATRWRCLLERASTYQAETRLQPVSCLQNSVCARTCFACPGVQCLQLTMAEYQTSSIMAVRLGAPTRITGMMLSAEESKYLSG